MSQISALNRVVAKLEDAGIPYMICGSVASSIHGKPRSTYDVDLVIDPGQQQLTRFIKSFGNEAYVSHDAAIDALRNRSMFNVIDHDTGWKLDLIIRKNRPYSVVEFRRRKREEVEGEVFYFASAEDALLSKLEWAGKANSERQMEDALGIAVAQGEKLDTDYLQRWAAQLGVKDLLDSILTDAEDLGC